MIKVTRNALADLLELDCALQQLPSPTFSEAEKAGFVLSKLIEEGLVDARLDASGNALARLPGGDQRPLVVSAHMDTVYPLNFPLKISRTPEKIFGPSIGDNSLGVAVLLSLPRLLYEENLRLPGDLWLVANVGEEGLGNLAGMRALVDHFGSLPVAYLILEGMGLGQIYHRGLGVERYRITARTAGGHSWVDYGKPSAIHHLAELITRITALPVPHQPRTSLNVGVIEGGTTINTIAARASLELDLRSEDNLSLQTLVNQIKYLVQSANQPGACTEIEQIGLRPAGEIPLRHPLVRLVENSLREEGIHPHPEIASTDANIPLSRSLPAVCVGITTGGYAHTSEEYIDIAPIRRGVAQVLRIVSGVWGTA